MSMLKNGEIEVETAAQLLDGMNTGKEPGEATETKSAVPDDDDDDLMSQAGSQHVAPSNGEKRAREKVNMSDGTNEDLDQVLAQAKRAKMVTLLDIINLSVSCQYFFGPSGICYII